MRNIDILHAHFVSFVTIILLGHPEQNNTDPKRVKTEILYKPDLVVKDSLSHPDVNISLRPFQ